MQRNLLFPILFLSLVLIPAGRSYLAAADASKNVILSTTTSTQDSGLLDVLISLFEKKSRYNVKPISVGTGKALELAAKGEADVVLVHAPGLEKKYVASGKFQNRRLVMYNDFVIAGPKTDPAGIKSIKSAADAMASIAVKKAQFVSRGDNSGTHNREKSIWKAAGVAPKGEWYVESGQGMGATLRIANDRDAYVLTDRATYLAFQKRLEIAVLLEGDKRLLNIYSVMEVNPANGPRINSAGGKAFADFMVSPEAQSAIGTFGVEKYGRPLFVPVAGMKEQALGG
jgi:tungstate transport system substrate-binding protein